MEEEFIELEIREKINEIDSIELNSYKEAFEQAGFLFENGSFEDEERDRVIYFELSKNKEEYIVFVYFSKKELEISEYYVTEKSLCVFS